MRFDVFIGCYAPKGAQSLLRYAVDTEKRSFQLRQAVDELENPSYLLPDEKRGLLYCVEEISPSGRLTAVNLKEQPMKVLGRCHTQAGDPCHLAMEPDGNHITVTNYCAQTSDGSITRFALNEQGMPAFLQRIAHRGSGPNARRQAAPHPHSAWYVGKRLLVCDLGADRLVDYRYQDEELEKQGELALEPGSGPRHLCFSSQHPEWIYVLCELSAVLYVFQWRDNAYHLRQTLDTLPPEATPEQHAENYAGAIKMTPDGRFVFVSNRGYDSLTVFSVKEDRTLQYESAIKTGGSYPRDFALVKNVVVVGHQKSGTVTAFRFDAASRSLTSIPMWLELSAAPVCIAVAPGSVQEE